MSEATGMSPLKRALLSIETLQDRVRTLESERAEPIAVIGIACRFPGGGTDPEAYYQALLAGVDAVRERPPVSRPGWPDDMSLPPAGYLEHDVAGFDAAFFGISPREAESIDPQHRLALECAWEALEGAGIDPRGLEGSRTGVYVGMAANDYAQMQLRSDRVHALLHSHFASGIGHSMVSGRISYLLGLQGPSITLDTACSSSLVGVHLACQSLRARESDLTLAIGVNLILAPDYTIAFQQSRMLSGDGRCRTFDADADGFSRAEGCGVLVLKRLADAQRDGDPVLAVIRASAVNQDGPSSGLTAPNGPAQSALIRAALAQAGLAPGDIGYIEAHGTGTSLGDPIEVQALGEVFNEDRDAASPLLVGSVKTNLGHLEAAAGIAGLIKLIQAVRHGVVPPHLHFRTPSPHIPWSELRIAVPTESSAFPVSNGLRRGGVSAFGFSGTNVHVIVEQAPVSAPPAARDDAAVLMLSAAEAPALRALAESYVSALRDTSDRLVDVAFTAAVGRAHLPHRLALVAADPADAAQRLEEWLRGEEHIALRTTQLRSLDRPTVAFLFTGQGAQHAGMGWALREHSAVVRRALDECDALLRSELEVPLLEVLDPASPHAELINRTDYTQPALFALQYALAALWRTRGVTPTVVAGHSIGEFAAAHLAGVFSLEDALRLVALRGRLMHAVQTPGRMEAIFTTEERVRAWVDAVSGPVSIAGINAPDQIVISGAVDAVEAIVQHAREAGVSTRPLRTSQAFHSPLMDGVLATFRDAVSAVTLQPARRVRFVSTMTGAVVTPDTLADPEYWVKQLRAPVRFADAAHAVAAHARIAVELGPHPSLAALVAQNGVALPVYASLHRENDAWRTLLTAERDLYLAGAALDWRGAAADSEIAPRRVALPTYPFQRVPLWVDIGSGRAEATGGHPLLGRAFAQPGTTRVFERTLAADAPAFIGEHVVRGRTILPGTAYLEMGLAAARELFDGNAELRDIDLLEPMVFAPDERRRVHVRADEEGEEWRITVHSAAEPVASRSAWTQHAVLHVARAADASRDTDAATASERLADIRARCRTELSGSDFHAALRARGYTFGPRLGGVQQVRVGTSEALADVVLPAACAEDRESYVAHPLVLDAGLQCVSCALADASAQAYLPLALGRVQVHGPLEGVRRVHARVLEQRAGTVTAEATFYTADGAVLATLERVAFRAVQESAGADPFLELAWEPVTESWNAPALATDTLPATLESGIARFARSENAVAYDAFVDVLESESALWVKRAFVELGWDLQPGHRLALAEAASRFGVIATRQRLLARALDILAEEGVLARDGDAWEVRAVMRMPDPPAPLDGDAAPEHVLLRRCGPALAQALRGAIDPLELLFPGGDGTLAESMYYDAPLARMLNGSVADVLQELIANLPAGRVLRVLEVGGGTAGTTRRMVERLFANGGRPLHYTFTDVSPMFVERARRRFAELPGFAYGTLDLDRAPEAQGFVPGSFDVVIAANCLHAARDLTAALTHMGTVLRSGGVLLAPEVFAPHRWFDLTVGLTDGWWHFTDTTLRPAYTCVRPEVWRDVLAAAGFAHNSAIPIAEAAGTTGHASRGQGVVAAVRADRVAAAGAYLLVDDGGPLAQVITARLEDQGATVVRVGASPDADPGRLAAQIADTLRTRPRWAAAVHCVAIRTPLDVSAMLDVAATHNPSATLDAALRQASGSLLALAQAVTGASAEVARLALLTHGAQSTGAYDADLDPVQAANWGLLRAVAQEAPDLACSALDLDAAATPDDGVRWLRGTSAEPELALRGGITLAPRLRHRVLQDDGLPAEYRLAPDRRGSIDDLQFRDGERSEPGPGQVEIRVAASALNFKDVLNVLGMYPGDPGLLGSECAGVVTRVGANVSHVRPGDKVIASAGGAYGRHVVAEGVLTARKPAQLSFAEAATLPVAYLTAHFALNHLGRMQCGDRVLIHAAAGGVGLAACHLALRAGATVYATAGSEAKRAMLRGLGIERIYDSRSLAFAEQVIADTDGAGVTMVLNSLADDFVDASFRVAARGARFLEIGKRGIWTHEQVATLDRDIAYHVIDWGATSREQPELVGRLFREVVEGVAAGALPPLPRTEFPLASVSEAFRYMAQAKHTGKIVLRHPLLRERTPLRFRGDATYLVTGGTAGLGLATAEWAAAQGARTLVLVSRSAPGEASEAVIERLRSQGVDVQVRAADVGDAAQVQQLVDDLRATLPAVRGVIHAAGALADRTLPHITWQDFQVVLRAKVHGTVLLAEALREELDFFVAYSSIASVFGSPGQANHSAANAFLDAYVARLPGMSIAWGPWSETGAAVRAEVLERNRERGLEPLGTAEGLAWVENAFAHPGALLIGARIVKPDALHGERARRLVQDLAPAAATTAAPQPAAVADSAARPFTEQIATLPAGARRAFVANRVKTRVRKVLGLPVESALDTDRPLGELGLDSLLAIELRNVLGEDMGRRLPATLLFDHPTTGALADHLLELLDPGDAAAPATTDVQPVDALAAVDALSDDDVDRLLAEKFSS